MIFSKVWTYWPDYGANVFHYVSIIKPCVPSFKAPQALSMRSYNRNSKSKGSYCLAVGASLWVNALSSSRSAPCQAAILCSSEEKLIYITTICFPWCLHIWLYSWSRICSMAIVAFWSTLSSKIYNLPASWQSISIRPLLVATSPCVWIPESAKKS